MKLTLVIDPDTNGYEILYNYPCLGDSFFGSQFQEINQIDSTFTYARPTKEDETSITYKINYLDSKRMVITIVDSDIQLVKMLTDMEYTMVNIQQ